MDGNIFSVGTRSKMRFQYKGTLTIEDLWDLTKEELNEIYLDLKKSIRDEEGLMDAGSSTENNEIHTKMEIVKTIFTVKKTEAEDREAENIKNQKRREILAAIAEKDSEDMKGKTREELEQMLNEL